MAKVRIVADAVVITSSETLENLKLIQKYAPKALTLNEADENGKFQPVFRVAVGSCGKGSITEYGATFSSETLNPHGLATITLIIPEGVEDAANYVADKIGTQLMMLNELEDSFETILELINSNRARVMSSIETIA